MRLDKPLDKILGSEIKVRALRIFCRSNNEVSGRQMAKMVGVTPKTAHEILQDLLREGVVVMRTVGKTYLFRLNGEKMIVQDVLKPLFAAEKAVGNQLFDVIRERIRKSALKDGILSVVVFGSVYAKTERAGSDIDFLVVVKTAELKKKAEGLFFDIDRYLSSRWGNLVSPYVNSLTEFRMKAKKKTGAVSEILRSYQVIYGERLERLLR